MAALAATMGVLGRGEGSASPDLPAGWGVDGCISCHAAPGDVEGYLRMVENSGVRYIRERTPGDVLVSSDSAYSLGIFRRERAAGLRVVAFAELPGRMHPTEEWDQAPEDLMAVYKAARTLGKKTAGTVDVWELQGEPDTFACKDLPDRMMAAQKAAYLGIKDGGADTEQAKSSGTTAQFSGATGVLMGGIATAPGPWAMRAVLNGLYEYTDGLNFHFYGHARDFVGTIEAQRDLARRAEPTRHLPIWVTECGLDAVPAGNPQDAHAREMQREFTLETSRTAIDEGLAVLMQFILVTPPPWGGHALAREPGEGYPAWTAYADFTRRHSLPPGPAIVPPVAPSRVVLQWQPDYETCLPQKVSGAYWFWSFEEGGPSDAIEGSIVAYNFSEAPARGRLILPTPAGTKMSVAGTAGDLAKEIEIPAFGKVQFPVRFELSDAGHYIRTFVDARFRQQGSRARSTL
ncbi:MAG TPA: hypothetical protein VIM48_06800, partial [Chthoniobacterales bacterium]